MQRDHRMSCRQVAQLGLPADCRAMTFCEQIAQEKSRVCFDRNSLATLAPDIEVLATREGLTVHRESALVRVWD